MDLEREEEEPDIDKAGKSQTKVKFDPWCPLRAPKAELKQLPVGLRYEYLGPNETYPVIVNAALTKEETALLVRELRKHRKALGYSLDDLTGISPELCTHRIILEDESSSSIEHQRRLNPNLKEVVKKEIMKLLKAGVIYPISDSAWVSDRGIRSSPFLSLILQVHRSEVVNGYRTRGPDCTLQVMSLRTS
ncbi:unnamed protein product [Microthlaspi erraticum]|uniref:Reverse transcriptase domain-containing protein n=1 Tax=Microthlaspi erraticum TaxID=1685480 RepID=A0A6D2JTI6_9BRAS|nr:unnamed protein product [Microthlaspi erraticum]